MSKVTKPQFVGLVRRSPPLFPWTTFPRMKNHPHDCHYDACVLPQSATLDDPSASLNVMKLPPYRFPRRAVTALSLLGLTLISLVRPPALAQSITAAPDGTGTTVLQTGNQFAIQGGTTVDQTLFHSFQDFGLSANETAQFLSNPNIQNILTRVVSGNPSIINGLITVIGGNSNLYLMNPAGIVFGPNAQLNVPADFLATTATGIDFANGIFYAYQDNTYADLVGSPQGFIFSDTDSGTVINTGHLRVNPGQQLGLLGKTVINTGQLSASGGTIQVVGVPNSSRIRISQPNQLLSLEVDPSAATRPGQITALDLPQLLTGPTDLSSVVLNSEGKLHLKGSDLAVPVLPGLVALSGELDTQSTDAAHTPRIQIEGNAIALTAATLDASGTYGGGQITIGTDTNRVIVDQASTLRANTTGSEGNGGDILIWSDEATAFLGALEARGGRESGDGGFIEVSSYNHLTYNGHADLTAPHGQIGTLYLDPSMIFIVNAATGINDDQLPTILENNSPGSEFRISDTALNNQTGNIIIEATGTIAIENNANLNFLSPNVTFRANTIISNAPLTGKTFTFDAQSQIRLNELVTADTVNLSAKNVVIQSLNSGPVGIKTTDFNITANSSVIQSSIQGTGTLKINTFSPNQDIFVGQATDTPAWDLSSSELDQFQGFSAVQLGDSTNTGTIRFTEDASTLDFINRAPLTIVGAQELIGFNQDTTWLLQGHQQGQMNNSQVSFGFQNVQTIQGGNVSDRFVFDNQVLFGGVLDGGLGQDTLDYSNYGSLAQVDFSNHTATGTLGVFQIEAMIPFNQGIQGQLVAPSPRQDVVPDNPFLQIAPELATFSVLEMIQGHDRLQRRDRTFIHHSIMGGDLEAAIASLDGLYSDEFSDRLGIERPQQLSFLEMQGILKTRSEATGMNTAMIYAIVRSDQLDLILIPPVGRPIAYTVPVHQTDLFNTIQKLRLEIGDPVRRQTVSYRPYAQQLYQWLIAPLKADLKRFDIQSLIFSLDTGLRAIPMAALYDGNQFLLEQYSLSLVPSLSLTQTHYTNLQRSSVLAMGISDFQSQPDLPAVPAELTAIANTSAHSTTLFNDQVTLANWQHTQQTPVDIVHLATHAEFQAGNLDNSYIQLWDQPLTLETIEAIPWEQQGVNLLVLSACRTAVGSTEAEFGFAGLAVKTGVNSALASIWYANDLATLALMQEFYQQLTQVPMKAEALRQAQLALLNQNTALHNGRLVSQKSSLALPPELSRLGDRTLSHPYYWSGFTLIGSPW